MNVYGVIEASSTKFFCVILTETKIIEQSIFKTTTPDITMKSVCSFFNDYQEKYGNLKLVVVGSITSVVVDSQAKNYGEIRDIHNKNWFEFNIYNNLKENLKSKIYLETNANLSAVGEGYRGQCKGLKNYALVTLSNNIDVGVVVEKKPLHGLLHNQIEHSIVKRYDGDDYEGYCPYHKDCVYGLATMLSIEDRLGISAQNIPKEHETWDMLSYYVAQLLYNITISYSTQKIVLNGELLKIEGILENIKEKFSEISGSLPGTVEENYIVQTDLKPTPCIIGGLFIGKNLKY